MRVRIKAIAGPLLIGLIVVRTSVAEDLNLELARAVNRGEVAKIGKLVSKGADVNGVVGRGECRGSHLYTATVFKRAAVVEALLRAGANVNRGGSCVGWAAKTDSAEVSEIVKLLLERGADPNAQTKIQITGYVEGQQVWRNRNGEESTKSFFVGVKIEPFTPLGVASFQGDLAMVRLLLGANASIDLAGPAGHTPLLLALGRGQPSKSAEGNIVPEELIVRGASPLMLAARLNRPEIVTLLMEKGAKRDARNAAGITAADIAARQGFHDVVELVKVTEIQSGPVTTDVSAPVTDRSQTGVLSPSTKQLIESVRSSPRNLAIQLSLLNSATADGRQMKWPRITSRAILKVDNGTYKILIDPRIRNAPESVTAWTMYAGAKMKWRNDKKKTLDSPETIGEALAGFEALVGCWSEAKAKEPRPLESELDVLLAIRGRGLLPAFVYFDRFSNSPDAGFLAWHSAHREDLHRYVDEVVLMKK